MHARFRFGKHHRADRFRDADRRVRLRCISRPFGAGATWAADQAESLKPGRSQPCFSRRASWVSPPRMLLNTIGPVACFHEPSETIAVTGAVAVLGLDAQEQLRRCDPGGGEETPEIRGG